MDEFFQNLDRLHTTEAGFKRIIKNLRITLLNPMTWCKTKISKSDRVERVGKNWYAYSGNFVFVINASTFNLITARKVKN